MAERQSMDQIVYWRSPLGAAHWDSLWATHLATLTDGDPLVASHGTLPCPILEFRQQATGLSYLLSSGLGGYVLGAAQGATRMELFLMLPIGMSAGDGATLLQQVADFALERRLALGDEEVIAGIDCTRLLPRGATVSLVVAKHALWLSPEQASLPSFYPLQIVELALLTSAEARDLDADPDAFAAAIATGQVDLLDPQRRA